MRQSDRAETAQDGALQRSGGLYGRCFGAWALASPPSLPGCSGPQLALDPAGTGAERLATLFWTMAAGALLIWILVLGLALYAGRAGPAGDRAKAASNLLLWGGAVVPTVVLLHPPRSRSLAHARAACCRNGAQDQCGGRNNSGWRIRYLPAEGEPVESANEIRLPADQQVELPQKPDVIHSFWIPPLGGKLT